MASLSPSPRGGPSSAIKIKEQKFMNSEQLYQQKKAEAEPNEADMKNELN
jgi:hypothetical protein